MNITLSLEQQKFIQSQIQKGRYTNSQDVINKALELLAQQERADEISSYLAKRMRSHFHFKLLRTRSTIV